MKKCHTIFMYSIIVVECLKLFSGTTFLFRPYEVRMRLTSYAGVLVFFVFPAKSAKALSVVIRTTLQKSKQNSQCQEKPVSNFLSYFERLEQATA